MKTEVAPTTNSTTTTTATTTARIASTGAVVCIEYIFEFHQTFVSLKVPEETSQYDDIENRTKIMMRFMDDLTNIYFSTRNSLRLTVENGLFTFHFLYSEDFISYFQMDHAMVIAV